MKSKMMCKMKKAVKKQNRMLSEMADDMRDAVDKVKKKKK